VDYFIRGYGWLFFLFAFLNVFLPTELCKLLRVDLDSRTGTVVEMSICVIAGAIFLAIGWKVNHPSRILAEGIETRRWFPFTRSGHMCFLVKLEYLGLLLIVGRSLWGGLRLLA